MSAPVIWNGRRSKLLSPDGLLTSVGRTIDYDGLVNYIANPGIEINAVGYNTFNNAAAPAPTSGTGGSATITALRTVSSPLTGTGSLQVVKGASNRNGDGFSYDFTIDESAQGRVLTVKFNYNVVSGTYADGDMTVWLYDVTNSRRIQPAPTSLLNLTSVAGPFSTEFQTYTDSTSYRLIVYVTTGSTSAYTLNFDDFFVGLLPKQFGTQITDWTSFNATATLVGGGSPTFTEMWWKREGDSMYLRGRFTLGTTTSSTFGITLPLSASVNAAKEVSTATVTGKLVNNTTAVNWAPIVTGNDTTLSFGSVTGSSGLTKAIGTAIGASGNPISFDAGPIPITGWASYSAVAADADTRVVAAKATGTPASATATNPLIFPTVGYDTHTGYSATTGRYSVQVPGYYRCSFFVNATNSAEPYHIYKNASQDVRIALSGASGQGGGSGTVLCVAGDIIDIRPTSAGTGTTGASGFITFEKVSGPSFIAASDSVNGRYFGSTTTITASLATIVWTTTDYQSHNMMASGVVTIPISGKYLITSALTVDGTYSLNLQLQLVIQKNGTSVSRARNMAGGANTSLDNKITDVINCIAGDTIRIQAFSDSTSPTIPASTIANCFSISKVGN